MRGTRTGRTAATIAAVLLAASATVMAAAPARAQTGVCEDELDPFANIPSPGWAQERLNFEKAWPFTERGDGVKVAVIDTGVDLSNPQLSEANYTGINQDFVGDGVGAERDCDGHGTAIASIIAAPPADYTGLVGVAPNVELIPIRVSADAEEDSPSNETLAEAVDFAVANQADVINISFESTDPFPMLQTAIENAIASGAVVVASSGNHGAQTAYPAEYPGVISVGAIDQNGLVPDFSGHHEPVSVVAPGVGVLGAMPVSGQSEDPTLMQGTSFAAPYVSGVAALIIDRFDGDISPAEVKRRIELTADETGYNLPDQKYGWGVVNPYAAVTEELPAETAESNDGRQPERVIPPIERAAAEDTTARNVALAVSGGGLGAVLLTLGGVAAYRRGRERGWRPGVPRRADS